MSSSSGGVDPGLDLTEWSFWWEFNKDPYLNLKSTVLDDGTQTGSLGWFLGDGEKDESRDHFRPSDRQIRQQVVPALLEALAKESDNDILTGCMIALAKIGEAPSESGESELVPRFEEILADKNQEISETAAIALGILGHPRAVDPLCKLLLDAPVARDWAKRPEVPYRTRAFAAYGLGLLGARLEGQRSEIAKTLQLVLETGDSKVRDVKVACLIALGMVPVSPFETPAGQQEQGGKVRASVATSRAAQLDYLIGVLEDDTLPDTVRAHCPTALARLLTPDLPAALTQRYRTRVADGLLAMLAPRSNAPAALQQSAAQALGLLGTNDLAEPLDRRIMEALAGAGRDMKEIQARHFALISLAKIGGRTVEGAKDAEGGRALVARSLLGTLADGKGGTPSWAALAIGVFGDRLKLEGTNGSGRLLTLQTAIREALSAERSAPRVAALAIAAGLLEDPDARQTLVQHLQSVKDETTQGYVALGLGLLGARESMDDIQRVLEVSKYKPELLKQAAIALGLLGDKDAVEFLVQRLALAQGLATQAALSSALGFIGDSRSIEPLVTMLRNRDLTPKARGFAAVALGIVGELEPLPWNTPIALDLNYRASTSTLTDPAGGTGILDLL